MVEMQGSSSNKLLNFADLALSLPIENLEFTLKQNPELVNCKGFGGQTALHKAVLVGNLAVTQILLRCGADPNLTTNSGETSLHIACSRGALKILVALLTFGGDLALCDQNGHYPIHCAALSGSIILVQYLSEVCESDLQILDGKGASILHGACAGGHLDLVQFLLKVKRLMSLNGDDEGNTVLHHGAASGLSGVCWAILINGGESLLISRNKNGHTPLQVAEKSLSVSRQCKSWLHKWTSDYEKHKRISSPKWDWMLLLVTPLLILNISIMLAVIAVPEKQWLIGVPGFIYFLYVLKKQQHRISHPVRWANPFYLGTYASGLFSAICCFLWKSEIYINIAISSFMVVLVLYAGQLCFFYTLIREDAGKIYSNGYCKSTLIKLVEDRLEGRYCAQCFIAAPSVSHHCRLCESCYLHLDHHCLFLNTCIADSNHWNFVIFLILNLLTMTSFMFANFYIAPVMLIEMSFGEWLILVIKHWLTSDVWTLLLMILHAGSLLWGVTLLRKVSKEAKVGLFESIVVPTMLYGSMILHAGSLLWGVTLLRYQYSVISTQQTSYYRIKAGTSKYHFTASEKLFNFCKFLYHKKVSLASVYFEA